MPSKGVNVRATGWGYPGVVGWRCINSHRQKLKNENDEGGRLALDEDGRVGIGGEPLKKEGGELLVPGLNGRQKNRAGNGPVGTSGQPFVDVCSEDKNLGEIRNVLKLRKFWKRSSLLLV